MFINMVTYYLKLFKHGLHNNIKKIYLFFVFTYFLGFWLFVFLLAQWLLSHKL